MNISVKKIIKILGNVITVLAVYFVLKKLVSNDVDYSVIFVKENIFPAILIILIMALIVIGNSFPWRKLVEILSGRTVPVKDSIAVHTKSNLLKYLPGNVFHYVARNELAIKLGIKHFEVAAATVIDIALAALSALLISLFFLHQYIFEYVVNNKKLFVTILVVLMILFVVFLIIFLKFRNFFVHKFGKYIQLLTFRNIKSVLLCLSYYIVSMLIASAVYMGSLVFILNMSLSQELFMKLFAAYTLSWLVGFITPGAPAGIGVKEAVMLGVTGGMLGIENIVLSMIVFRVFSMVSDVIGAIIPLPFVRHKALDGDK